MASVKGDDGTSSGLSPGTRTFGVWGDSKDGFGVIGTSSTLDGEYGESDQGNGVFGKSNIGFGVVGISSTGTGVHGESDKEYGVAGLSNKLGGVYGYGKTGGVAGTCDNANGGIGVFGSILKSGNGVVGQSSDSYGIYALSNNSYAVGAIGGIAAVYAHNGALNTSGGAQNDVHLATQNDAGEFNGNVSVIGNITKSGGGFKINHPADPANKYLCHSFVESSDMKNIYDGVVVLDEKGKAEVQLPEWFGPLNKDFRYQLTAIGSPSPNLYVEEELTKNNRFKVAGGKHSMKVSWQITGIRKDPWANTNRLKVEEEKPSNERDYYLHPELYDKPAETSIVFSHYREHQNLDERTKKAIEELERESKDMMERSTSIH